MPAWLGGGIGPIVPDVLSQCSMEPEARETGWLYSSSFDVPSQAFLAAENELNLDIFIGRTVLDGDLVPGMIIPETEDTLFANNGRVSSSDDKQILCGTHMKWVKCLSDKIHPRAIIGGRLACGNATYIGKTTVLDKVLIGRVDPLQNRQLFVPVDKKEIAVSDYDILIEGV